MADADITPFVAIMDAQDAARARFNSLPPMMEHEDGAAYEQEEEQMLQASRAADRAVPTSWAEFTRLLEHMSCGGSDDIDETDATRLICHARRLLAAGGH